jgi:hypothetical protein
MADNRWLDPEVDAIFEGDNELAELAHRVRAARPEPPLDPRFQTVLRAQLMREAPAILGAPATPRAPRTAVRRRGGASWWRPARVAWAGAGLGVALAAAGVLTLVSRPIQDHQVTAVSPVAQLHAVSPDNVITVAFSQPMNQASVVAGLHIRPATEVSTAWQGNNLVITPTHHLTGNTPYTVTIDKAAAVATNGSRPAADIRISFGTAPAPPAVPSVATLAPAPLGPVGDSATLVPTADGSVIATSGSLTALATPSPSPSAPPSANPSVSASPLAVPTPSGTALSSSSPRAAPSATPALQGELVALSPSGSTTDLGPAAASAALSPNGLALVAAVPTSTGTQVVLVPVSGRGRTVLAVLSTPVLATGWRSADTALVAEADRVVTVDLQGHVTTVATLPGGTSSVVFAPGGGYAFAGSSTGAGQLINLVTQATRALVGSSTLAAFSGDGATVAWVDSSASSARLVTSPVASDAADSVPLKHPFDRITDLALDATGSRVAFVDQPAASGATLQLVALPTGTLIATGPAARAVVFSPHGDHLVFASAGSAQVATIGGGSGFVVNVLPDGAAAALEAFVAAQVAGDASTLDTLVAPGLDAVAATPHGLTRAYVISEIANVDGTLGATARLISDATPTQPLASFADETLTLSKNAAGHYLVGSVTVGTLQAEPVGPHVVKVTPSVSGQQLVVRIAFDSDLRAATVPGAVTVTRRGSSIAIPATTVYDPDSRTATVTLDTLPGTLVTVDVATSLVDVDGQALATAFSVDEGGTGR